MIEVRFQRGIELPGHALWLDPWDSKETAFVSHAHSDHLGNHRTIIASAPTARLMAARLNPMERTVRAFEFEVPNLLGELQVTLLPAGHILGSAQFHAESEDGSLLYTGDFKLRPSHSSEPIQWRKADLLIMETTFGLPKFRFPPTEVVLAQIVAFCQDVLEEKCVPVLVGYSLGKSQEILCALAKAGLPSMLHPAVYKMTEVYRELRPSFPPAPPFDPHELHGKVLLAPPSALRSPWLRKIRHARTAFLTGWALEKGARFRYQCDAVFPLSDHADYDDLLRYVELVGPSRVLTLHGFASAFANDLRERGIEAWALSEQNQLQLPLFQPVPAPAPEPAAETALGTSRFGLVAEAGERIAATPGKRIKVEQLQALFRTLTPEELAVAAVYLGGRPFPQGDARNLQIGWATLKRALLQVSAAPEHQYRMLSHLHADPGKIALELLRDKTKPEPWGISESRDFFEQLQRTRGPIQKSALLADRFARLSALEASYVVKILTGDLRIGLKEGLVEEAIASAFGVALDAVRRAHMLTGDLGQCARMAKDGTIAQASPKLFRPLQCMLATPEPTPDSLWARCAAGCFWVEEKFDGVRAQFHCAPGQIEIFSRDLKPVTEQFQELARAAQQLNCSAIFDGEIVAFDPGRRLTFFDLQKRLGRKEADLFLGSDIPVRYVVFDLLWLDGRSLLEEPLRSRRALLERIILPDSLQLAPIEPVSSAGQLEQAFQRARAHGNEGLVAKDLNSPYTPGRRGLAWLKLKKALATLDVVVVGAEFGHGKRSGLLSDYTFAVRDPQSGAFLPVGKAYTGLTDAEIAELTELFLANTLSVTGRYHTVTPQVVLEVAFDSIQPSRRHPSGLALRFPRIKAIRRDKGPGEIDTLDYARSLAQPG